MVTLFPCIFCFGRLERGNVTIQEESRKDYQDIIECSKKLLKGEIERDFSVGIYVQEICSDCFECSEKIYKINKQLIEIQERLNYLVADFVAKINFRVSNSATETWSFENVVKVEADDDFSLKEEPICKTDNEDEESNVDFENESYPLFHFDSYSEQDDLLAIGAVNEAYTDDNAINQEHNSTSNPANAPKISFPSVVLPRLQFDKNRKPRSTNTSGATNSPVLQKQVEIISSSKKERVTAQNRKSDCTNSPEDNSSTSAIERKTFTEWSHYCEHEKQHKRSRRGKVLQPRTRMPDPLEVHSSEKSYECETCGGAFQMYSTYKEHLSTHKERFRCHQCNKTYSTKESLNRHKTLHRKSRPFLCEECGKGFANRPALKEHSYVHSVGEFRCDICGTMKSNIISFRTHVRLHTYQKKYACEICGLKATSNGAIQEHIKTVHEKIQDYQCSTCGKKFGFKLNLTRHEETHKTESERKKYNCNICPLVFSDASMLMDHKSAYHTVYTSGYIYCDKCQCKFINGCEMVKHSPRSHNNNVSKCKYCTEIFKDRCNLLSHLANFHPAEKNPYKCQTCQAVFRLESLRKHSPNCNISSSDVNILVNQCDPQEERVRRKKSKKRSTEDEVQKFTKTLYNCSICQESFTDKRKLRKHKMTHEEIHHICKVCKIEYPSQDELKEHTIKIHSDGNRFKCDLCEKTYTTMKNLRTHRRNHTGEKPFVCETCGKAYSCAGYLSKHKKTHKF